MKIIPFLLTLFIIKLKKIYTKTIFCDIINLSVYICKENRMENKNENIIAGRNAVRELLRSGRDVDKVLVVSGQQGGSLGEIIALAKKNGIVVTEISKQKMDTVAKGIVHQGVCAYASSVSYSTVEDILAEAESRGEKPFIVIADEINDPHNLGAIIRCAEGAGVHGVIIPKHRSVGLTSVVAKASAGAIEHMHIAKVTNIARTVDELKEKGVWVFAADMGGQNYYDTDLNCACAIVMGSEGKGITRLVREKCDEIISIPMYGKVNSFNVSTACAVLLCEAAKQKALNK